MPPDTNQFRGAKVLITGGLGFIGSNLAIRLVEQGAQVTLVDAMIPEFGGNLFNIEPIRDRVTVNFGDICDRHAMNWLVRGQDYVFHLAGQVSHVMSLTDPFPDLEWNIKGTAVVMEAPRWNGRGTAPLTAGSSLPADRAIEPNRTAVAGVTHWMTRRPKRRPWWPRWPRRWRLRR